MATVEPSTAMESAGCAPGPVRPPDSPTRIVPSGLQLEGILSADDSGGAPVLDERFHANSPSGRSTTPSTSGRFPSPSAGR